jgi:UDPglucose 6-dehydrogenase
MTRIAVYGEGHLADATRVCLDTNLCETSEAEVLWFCVDTPVDDRDRPDTGYVTGALKEALEHITAGVPVLISSQVPVGFCRTAETTFPGHHLAIQPENIRKAHAVDDFRWQDRMIVGTRHPTDHALIESVLGRFTDSVVFMSPESAEMTKHTLNAFLGMEIAFANEIADVCELVGATTTDVFAGFRSDKRVGDGPLRPGGPFRGGTLGRDIHVLRTLGAGPLICGVDESNRRRL